MTRGLLGAVVLLVCGCGEVPPATPADAGALVSLPPEPTGPPLTTETRSASASDGVTITWPAVGDLPGGSLVIPPGALAEDTHITVSVQEGGDALEPGAVVYRFQPAGLRLLRPARLTLGYRESWSHEQADDESDIFVGWVSSVPESAIEVVTPTVDTEANTAWNGYVSPVIQGAVLGTSVSLADFPEISLDGRDLRPASRACWDTAAPRASMIKRVQIPIVDAGSPLPTSCFDTTGM